MNQQFVLAKTRQEKKSFIVFKGAAIKWTPRMRRKVEYKLSMITEIQTWNRYNMPKLCECIEEWNTEVLNLQYNQQPQILAQIRQISFPFLKTIYLSGNHLQSIESIERMQFPVLEKLWLLNNRISSVIPLKKWVFPSLKTLNIDGNQIRAGGQELCLMYLPALKQIDISREKDCSSLQDYCWLFKLETIRIQRIFFSGTCKVQNMRLQKKLKKRYCDFDIFSF